MKKLLLKKLKTQNHENIRRNSGFLKNLLIGVLKNKKRWVVSDSASRIYYYPLLFVCYAIFFGEIINFVFDF